MPTAPPRLCPCGGRKINGKCDRCGTYKGKHTRTTKQRGYGADWQRFVAQRKADPDHVLCHDCLKKKIVRPATERHHVVKIKIDPSKRLDPDNVMDLCGPCHDARTARGE